MDHHGSVEVATSNTPTHIPHWRQVFDSAGITTAVKTWKYNGSGTEDDPYAVTWIERDPRNPMLYSASKRWSLMMIVAMAALMVSLDSSAYSGSAAEIMREFDCSEEVFTLGISLFVLGFAVGPIVWGPLSEMSGRRSVFIPTYLGLTAFNAGAAGAQNMVTLLVLRFLGGAVGSNSLISAGAVVADEFPARQRGLALAYYAVTPFLGPTLGPIIGGFVAEPIGWRWIEGLMAIFTGAVFIVYFFTVPETYAPVILQRRAKELSASTGKVYKTHMEITQGPKKLSKVLKIALSRPWVLLLREPIVTVLSVYQAIIYATLYWCFAAFPIVYQEKRGWSPGVGGLAFLGVTVGMMSTIPYNLWTNRRYAKLSDQYQGFAPPESRLPLCMAGAIAAPISLFWFAWTNGPSVHWISSVAAGAPFGFGLVVIFQGINNYLVDSYTVFAASVLAGTAVLRSVFATVFPLFTSKMYHNLGIHWASMVPACLALVFAPFPFLLYRYGPMIRARCKYSAEAVAFTNQLQAGAQQAEGKENSRVDASVAGNSQGGGQTESYVDIEKRLTSDDASDNKVVGFRSSDTKESDKHYQ